MLIKGALNAESARQVADASKSKWLLDDLYKVIEAIRSAATRGNYKLEWNLRVDAVDQHNKFLKSELGELGYTVSAVHDNAQEHGYCPAITIKW